MANISPIAVPPMDTFNQQLIQNVHPSDWLNPVPAPIYNLVVVGAGTAGLVTAIGAAGLGAKVALIERHLMGGDCLNAGCVPSKAIIASSRVAAAARNAASFGVHVSGIEVDFPAVMERMRRLRAHISTADSAKRYASLGIDVFLGDAAFTSPRSLEVNGTTLRFKRACIATGARAATLPIEGLEETGYLTNETVFSLTERPDQLAVLGAGPIGCELAQAFQRLGSQVTVLELGPQVLPREDSDAAAIVRRALERDGVTFLLNCKTQRVERKGAAKVFHAEINGKTAIIEVDEILLSAGRKPNVDGLGLDAAGVIFDVRKGVDVDDHLQTSTPGIFAAGDICMDWKFTHAADFAARIVIQNALFSADPFGMRKLSALTMPWCTYTDPEISHVGMYESEAAKNGIELDTYVQPLEHVDRAILEDAREGFVKVYARKGTDTIAGATIVANNAGDLISEISVAMVNGVGLKGIASTIHPYPTQADAIRKIGDQFNRARLTPTVKRWMGRWLAWQRR